VQSVRALIAFGAAGLTDRADALALFDGGTFFFGHGLAFATPLAPRTFADGIKPCINACVYGTPDNAAQDHAENLLNVHDAGSLVCSAR
jgi:hypothetical protein